MESKYSSKNLVNNLKPLDEYLKDLKSRNSQFAEIIPDLQRTVLNVSSYDDLYKKLIEESYYICNELAKGKEDPGVTHLTSRNPPKDPEKEDMYKNINRALIFQSNENFNKLNREQELLSPIIKPPDENKSYFYSTTNRFNNTDVKEKNELNSTAQNFNTFTNTKKSLIDKRESNYIPNFNNIVQKRDSNLNISTAKLNPTPVNKNSSYIIANQLNQIKENTNNNENPNLNTRNLIPAFQNDDIAFMINNMREIEKLLEKDDPVNKIENFENKISLNLMKLEEQHRQEFDILETKKEIEKNIDDLNLLYKQFECKFEKLDEYLEIVKNIPTKVDENLNNLENLDNIQNLQNTQILDNQNKFNNFTKFTRQSDYLHNFNTNTINTLHSITPDKTFNSNFSNSRLNPNKSYLNKNQEIKEIKDYIIPSENQETIEKNTAASNNDYSMYSQSTYGNSFNNTITPREYSQKINSLFANSQIKEASDIWRRFNYLNFEGTSLQRSYEMLMYITRLKDKEIEYLNRKISLNEEKLLDMKRKDAEIVELFAQLETYKNKVKVTNSKINDNQKYEDKINNLMKENNMLYKENVRLKVLIQQENYLSNKKFQMQY
jgi:hypothetical protein